MDIKNIFEIQKIRNILKKEDENLNIFFEMLIVIVNEKINSEEDYDDESLGDECAEDMEEL